ncbi:MAG: bifunctional nicotinamidase/pyrazinamidase [Gemmatimonadota bacterium]
MNATDVRPEVSALLLVDIQPDFCPGGALAVSGGDEILAPVNALVERGLFGLYVATQDWHPEGHVSFASQHEGRSPMEAIELHGHDQVLWPDHCVQGTPGADLHPDIDWDPVSAIIRKGSDPRVDSYSGFRNNWNPDGERPSTGLAGYLRERGVEDVYVCGLARDVCVKWTAQDAVEAGFRTYLLWDLTRSVQTEHDQALRDGLEDIGVVVLESGEL